MASTGWLAVEAVTVASLCSVLSIMTHGVNTVALLYAVLAASATGFLLWNWYPAKIFMGDVGSGFIGYCFGALTLLTFFHHDLSLFVPLILLGVFVIDASVTLGKRLLRGGAWYAPHRTHAYQHLAQRYGHERTSLWVATVNLFWLAPWAALAQWHPAYSLLWLASAWSPLIVAAHVLRAGDSLGPWKGVDQHFDFAIAGPTAARSVVPQPNRREHHYSCLPVHGEERVCGEAYASPFLEL